MSGQRIGYIRVSTLDQHIEHQLDGIEVDKTFTDKASGKDTKRPQLELMMSFVRNGDTVIVHSMDRLARNLDDLRRIVQTLTGKGVRIEFVKEQLSFTGEDSPMANLMLSVMGAFAEFERALIKERQREGIMAYGCSLGAGASLWASAGASQDHFAPLAPQPLSRQTVRCSGRTEPTESVVAGLDSPGEGVG